MDNKKQIKIEQIKEENQAKKDKYTPNKKIQDKLTQFEELFLKDVKQRENNVKRYFNERTLEQMLDDSQKRVNGYTEPRINANDWQTKYRSYLTRNKMLAMLSKLATIRMKMDFKDKFGGGDQKKLRCFNAIYNYYEDIDNTDMKQFKAMWAAWQDGTVVNWILPQKKTQKKKEIIEFNAETGEYEFEEIILRKWKVVTKLLPLQDVWFGDIRETEEQEQPKIWLRFLPDYQDFIEDWGKFPNAKYVIATTGEKEEDNIFYRENDVTEDKVEILWYLNKWEDRMIIWANQIELYDGPLPYDDKEGKFYPLVVGLYELIAPDFIYGKSGGDKLKPDQDMIDLFYQILADRMIIQANPPIWNEGNPDLPETVKLGPGKTQIVDNMAGIKEFAFQDNSRELINIIKLFTESANQSSLESAPGGYARSGVTATADVIAENAIKQMVGLFQFFMESFMKKRAEIKKKLILQGIYNPKLAKAKIKDGKVQEFEAQYPEYVERNTILDDGTRGDRVYRMVESTDKLPTTVELDMMEKVAQKNGKNIQYTYFTPDYFEDFDAEIEPVMGSVTDQSPALKRALETEFQKGFVTLFPEKYLQNQNEFATDYIEAYEKDVDRLLGERQLQRLAPFGVPQKQNMGQIGSTYQPAYLARNTGVPQELRQMANI